MDIEVKGTTNGIRDVDEILNFCAAAARVCYSKYDFDTLITENKAKLIEQTLRSGHHSVFDHFQFNIYLSDIPKFGAMVLNNEKMYVSSEKSARYTQMNPAPKEKGLYDKWLPVFERKIKDKYPSMDDLKTKKLAQENARYLTSVFTPTKIFHTISFRQLNYVMHYFEEFMDEAEDNDFNKKTVEFMKEFNSSLKKYYIPQLKSLNQRSLSIFAKRKNHAEEFGENYSTTYLTSFACLGQLHRHRTIRYEMQPVKESEKPQFFIPPILGEENLIKEWVNDSESVSENYPQGQLIQVHESGAYTDFISKMCERLCGHSQLEIMQNTADTLKKYVTQTKSTNKEVHEILAPYLDAARCRFPKVTCRTDPCFFGPKQGIKRTI